jgi:predicted lactoylglutathione lyase
MANKKQVKVNQSGSMLDATLIQRIQEAVRTTIEQYQEENPGVDVKPLLSENKELLHTLGVSSNRELDKFIAYAKGQGTKMSFDAMETGILAAGRKDMQDGLAEIANSLAFNKPVCPECDEAMDNRGKGKKNPERRWMDRDTSGAVHMRNRNGAKRLSPVGLHRPDRPRSGDGWLCGKANGKVYP